MKDGDFKTSSFCGNGDGTGDGCVAVAIKGEEIRVKDTKSPDGGILKFNPIEWVAFIKGVKAGEFDL